MSRPGALDVREAPLRTAETAPTTPANQRLTPLLFVELMLGLLLAELDQAMFSTALPTIAGELGGVDRMLWVTTAYVLTGTAGDAGLGWRWAFWINLPLAAAAIAAGTAFLPSASRRIRPVRIDAAGIVAMTVAVMAIVLVASWGGVAYRWGSPVIVSISVIAVLASAVFVAVERQAADPIIPLAMFRNRTSQAATIASVVMAAAMLARSRTCQPTCRWSMGLARPARDL